MAYNVWSRYLGTVEDESIDPSLFERSGFGIERAVVYNNVVSEAERYKQSNTYEYYVGEWKNDKRHGNGYLMTTDKKIISAQWKKGAMIAGTDKDVSEAEVAFANKCIENINGIKIKRR